MFTSQITMLLYGVLGLIFGSFIAAFTYRYPLGISISKGRSFCPGCKHGIAWYDNIPLLSYFLLKGKCRNCKKKISVRYPLIEASTAILFVLFAGSSFVYFVILSVLIAIFVIDFEHQIIPDSLTFFLLLIVSLVLLLVSPDRIWASILSGFGASLFLLLVHLITRGRGMGLGDVKFAIVGGMLTGWPYVLPFMFVSFVIGGVIGLILLIAGQVKWKQRIAFGPFLVAGLIITVLFGDRLIQMFFPYL